MRYQVEFDDYGFNIIDTTVPDGENCLVDGAMNRAEAEAKCAQWNAKEEALIKYAPELLEAMKMFVRFHIENRMKFKLSNGDVPNRDASYYIEQGDVYIASLEAAIAKAEGKTR